MFKQNSRTTKKAAPSEVLLQANVDMKTNH